MDTARTERRPRRHTAKTAPAVVLLFAALTGCATFAPEALDTETDLERVRTKSAGDVQVSVAMLTDDQAARHFGADLGLMGLQALWISVRNASPGALWLIRNAIDPDFYPPDEAAELVRAQVPSADQERLRQHFRDESIRVFLEAGKITQGFVFLPRVEGGRYLEVLLGGDAWEVAEKLRGRPVADSSEGYGTMREIKLGFALPLPDGTFDYEQLDSSHPYHSQMLPDLSTQEFRTAVEALPCCTTDADGDEHGDPLNLVIVGDSSDVLNTLSRSGWSFTHRITLGTVERLIGAALNNKSYDVAPVSNLYAFGRKQDFALQRARSFIAQRNHMRFWLAPFLHEGRQVWVGQVSRDVGIKLTARSPTLTTHVIDPEVDLTREYLLHSLLSNGFVDRFGFAEGSRQATRDDPAFNLTGDPYFSDGMRLVIILSPEPIPYADVRSLRWERSARPMVEGQSTAADRYVRPIETSGSATE